MELELMELLVKLLIDNKLDRLRLGEFEILKSKHDLPVKDKSNNAASLAAQIDPDELLFWSSSSPALTEEQINDLAVNSPLSAKKKQRKSKGSI